MASVFPQARTQINMASGFGAERLARSMSWHASMSLLLFAGLQIWGVLNLIDLPFGRLLPFVALAMLLVGGVPFSRKVERRWHFLADNALPSSGLVVRFKKDRANLWRLAVLVPAVWLGGFALVMRALGY